MIIAEDNEAAIKIIRKGRCPTMRHISRTHRVAMDWLSETCNNERITMVYINTKAQTADILTKRFTKSDQWIALCQLMNIRPLLSRRSPAQAAPKRAPAVICMRSHNLLSMIPPPPKREVPLPPPLQQREVPPPPPQREVPPPPPPLQNSQDDASQRLGAAGDRARDGMVSWERNPLGTWLRASFGPQVLDELIRELFFNQETDSAAMIARNAAQWSSLADTMAKTLARHNGDQALLSALSMRGLTPHVFQNTARVLQGTPGIHVVDSVLSDAVGDAACEQVVQHWWLCNQEI